MDGLPGLERVFKEEFTNAKVQRCQVNVARNVLAKVPKKFKDAVADDLRSIFYASSKKKAGEFFDKFTDRWGKDLPSAVKCLDSSIDACLTFFVNKGLMNLIMWKVMFFYMQSFNQISILNLFQSVTCRVAAYLTKEFKRRTKPMEIVAGERACYTLLTFICLKMELHWRSNPIGKVRNNLPFFKESAFNNFTQLT
jgi:putative transposase